MLRFIALLVSFVMVASSAGAQTPERFRLHVPDVATTVNGLVDPAKADLAKSRTDLLYFFGLDHKKLVELVSTPEASDVVVEVVAVGVVGEKSADSVSETLIGSDFQSQGIGVRTGMAAVRTAIVAHGAKFDITGVNFMAYRRGAALDATKKIVKWLQTNRAVIMARRADK